MFILLSIAIATRAQTTEFTYQGSLSIGSPPAPTTGNYDLEFRLFAADTGGSAIGTQQRLNVAVSNGAFSVKLDFGAQFTGAARYLEIGVRSVGGGSFQTLLPRQQISNTPYAVRSLKAATADSIPVGGLPAGSGNYIQNTTTQQPANFNVSGNGILGGSLDVAARSRFRQNIGSTDINNTAGFWLYQNTPAADRAFIGMQNDDYVGLYGIGGGWGLIMNTQTGNVGIGTATPTSKLYVSGTGGIRANVNSDLNAGLGLTLNNAPKWSVATVTPGQFQIFNDAIGQNAVWIDPASNNVGIGSASPAAKLEVNGYTKLGSDAPSIRVKKLTGTTSAFEGSEVLIPTGLDPEKILSISVMVRGNDPTSWVDANSPLIGHRYYWYLFGPEIRVITVTGGSAQILSKPIKILVTYEQ